MRLGRKLLLNEFHVMNLNTIHVALYWFFIVVPGNFLALLAKNVVILNLSYIFRVFFYERERKSCKESYRHTAKC